MSAATGGPKILTLDIENTPFVAHVWQLYGANVGLDQVIEFPRVFAVGAKWAHRRNVMWVDEFHHSRDEVLRRSFEWVDEADVVVTYNGKQHDMPHLRREWAEAGMPPPAPWIDVDLYTEAKRMKFAPRKLANVTARLKLSGKLSNSGHQMWVRCMEGDPKAWAEMRRYGRQDVRTTEELYDYLKPWIKVPNVGLWSDEDGCPRCGSVEVERRGFAVKETRKYQRYQCKGCGGWFQGTRSVGSTTVKGMQ